MSIGFTSEPWIGSWAIPSKSLCPLILERSCTSEANRVGQLCVGSMILVAIVAHAGAREAVRQNPGGFVEQLAEGLAKKVRDDVMQSALQDLFPGLTQRQAGDIQGLISDAADGRLDFRNLNQQNAKQRLINDLRLRNPDLADAGAIAEFIYVIYQASQQR
jgi:hypothetical protein